MQEGEEARNFLEDVRVTFPQVHRRYIYSACCSMMFHEIYYPGQSSGAACSENKASYVLGAESFD